MPRKLFKLGLDPASYNPVGLRSYSDAQLQTEYVRIQKEARARLDSLRKSEYGRGSEIYLRNKGRYPALSKIRDRRQLERTIQEGARFVQSQASTAAGQQEIAKKQLESLAESGYGWLKRPMLKAWGAFMEWLGSIGGREAFYRSTQAEPEEEAPDYEEAILARQEEEEESGPSAQKRKFYQWAEENGYLTYETVTRRGKEVEKEVWYK